MTKDDLLYYLGFSHFLGIGPVRFRSLLKYFNDVQKAYEVDRSKLRELIGEKVADKFIQFRQTFDPLKKLEELNKKKIKVLTLADKTYPYQLKNISDPPICLYVKGDLNNFNFDLSENGDFFFAIVGTRKPSSYGQQITAKFAYELAKLGMVIVSGMAMGVDAAAHKAGLDAGGKTIAFLGCGVDVVYPFINYRLYNEIIEKGSLIVSEFPPGQTVRKGLFVARNRLISGLSKGILVVEGTKDSGSLITARYAANQGKDVFAPPVPLTSVLSEAPNILLKQGAKLVTSVQDILDEYNLKIVPSKKKEIFDNLNNEEKLVCSKLIEEPKLVDELVADLKIAAKEILHFLSMLEIKGVIRKNGEGKYEISDFLTR